MQYPVEHGLGDEDLQRIRDNELGAPLHIYKQKPGLVRLFRVLTMVMTLLLIVTLALFIFVQLKHWFLSHTLPQAAQPDSFSDDPWIGHAASAMERSKTYVYCTPYYLRTRPAFERTKVSKVAYRSGSLGRHSGHHTDERLRKFILRTFSYTS